MGEYADMAADDALNGGYWGDDPYVGDDADWAPYGRVRRRRKPSNAEIFRQFEIDNPDA